MCVIDVYDMQLYNLVNLVFKSNIVAIIKVFI